MLAKGVGLVSLQSTSCEAYILMGILQAIMGAPPKIPPRQLHKYIVLILVLQLLPYIVIISQLTGISILIS